MRRNGYKVLAAVALMVGLFGWDTYYTFKARKALKIERAAFAVARVGNTNAITYLVSYVSNTTQGTFRYGMAVCAGNLREVKDIERLCAELKAGNTNITGDIIIIQSLFRLE